MWVFLGSWFFCFIKQMDLSEDLGRPFQHWSTCNASCFRALCAAFFSAAGHPSNAGKKQDESRNPRMAPAPKFWFKVWSVSWNHVLRSDSWQVPPAEHMWPWFSGAAASVAPNLCPRPGSARGLGKWFALGFWCLGQFREPFANSLFQQMVMAWDVEEIKKKDMEFMPPVFVAWNQMSLVLSRSMQQFEPPISIGFRSSFFWTCPYQLRPK